MPPPEKPRPRSLQVDVSFPAFPDIEEDVLPLTNLVESEPGGILVETIDDATPEFFERNAELEDAELDLEISVLAGADAPRTGLLGPTQLRGPLPSKAAARPETPLTEFAGGVERIVGGGIRDAIVRFSENVEALGDTIEELTGFPSGGALAERLQDLPEIQDPESTGGQMARGVVQFFSGFVAGGAVLKGLGVTAQLGRLTPEVNSLISTVAAFSPDDPTVANLIKELDPDLQGPIKTLVDALATNPDDSTAINLAKRGIEDVLLGRLGAGAVEVVKFVGQGIDRAAKVISQARVAQRAIQGIESGTEFVAAGVIEFFQGVSKKTRELFTKAIDKAVKDGKIPALDAGLGDEGKVQAAILFALGRAGVGGTIGFAAGPERTEEAIKSALILAGLGALASPAMLKALAKRRLLKKTEKAFKESQVLEAEKAQLQINPTGLDPAQVEARIGELDQEIADLKPVEAFDKTTRDAAAFRRTNQQGAEQGNEYLQEVEKQRRGTVPREQTAAEAAANPMTVEEVRALMPGTTLNASQAHAMITTLRESADKIVALRDVVIQTGTDEAKRDFLGQLLLHGTMDPKRLGVLAESGRTLGELNQPVSGINQFLDQFTEVLAKSGESGLTMDRLVGMVGDLKTPAQLRHSAKQMTKPTFKDFFFEYWINALLSGPQTHVVNFMGNSIVTVWGIGERALAARLTKAGVQGVEKGEAKAMIYAGLEGIRDGLSIAFKVLKEGEEAVVGLSKIETPRRAPAFTAANVSATRLGRAFGVRSEGGITANAVDLIGATIRTSGRFLMSADELFKAINFRMEVHAQAFRKVSQETFANADEMAARFKFLTDNPTEEIFKAAEEFKAIQTFTNELGPGGKAIQTLSNSHPLAKLIIPFLRTPINIGKYTFQRMPFLNKLGTQHAADIAAGGARADLARAKQALGGSIMALAAVASLSGFITGRGPADPRLRRELRDTGWLPYALKIGDRYFAFNRFDPIGMFLGMAADLATYGADIVESSEFSRAVGAVWLATMNNLTSKTYLRGISEVMEITQPRFTAKPEDLLKNKRSYLSKLVGTLVPTIVANLARNMDPAVKDARGIIDELLIRIPGASTLVTNKLNIFGEVITPGGSLGPDLLSPIYTDTETKDPVKLAIREHQVALSMPSEHIRGVRLFTPEYWEFVRLAGVPAKKELDRYVGSRAYQRESDGPEGGKALEIRRIIQFHRTEAAALMEEKFDDLREQIEKKQVQKEEALRPKRRQEITPSLTR